MAANQTLVGSRLTKVVVAVVVGAVVFAGLWRAWDRGPGDVRAACGQITFSSFPPDLDEFPALDDDATQAIDELANGETGIEAAGFDTDFRWSIASRSGDRLQLFGQGIGETDGNYAYARFKREDGRWRPSGWGGCRVEAEASGYGSARAAFDPDRPIDAESIEVPLLIRERECASGRAPVDRDIATTVLETDASVTVIVLVEEVRGDADCPGNPWHPITITLDRPLGDRTLFDGHQAQTAPVALPDDTP